MPLKKGNTNIESVYLGTTPIGAIYKGTTLIYESFKWLPYSFTYLYHSLIPNVISGKTNKDLARVSKIYANGEIENQLVNSTDTSKTLTSGHKYLTFLNGAYALTNGTGQSVSVVGGTDMIIDLTHQFGAGNEPTSVDDNRIKRIIAKGSIPYNTGTYKGTNIEAFESEPFNIWDEEWELGSYNASTGNKQTATDRIRSKNKIKIVPNTEYYFNRAIIKYAYFYDKDENYISMCVFNSSNGYFLFTTPTNACYMTFNLYSSYGTTYNNNICINVSSSLNGTYKPHISPAILLFKYQGNGALNAHDTMEITKTEYVFTKNVDYVDETTMPTTRSTPQVIRIPRKHLGIVDLGSLNYIRGSSGSIYYFYAPVSGMKGGVLNALPNVVASIYTTKTTLSTAEATLNADKTISVGTSGNILIRNDTYTDETAFKQAMAGTYLFYETANEVAEIDTEIVAQGGGTITSDSEVLPNVDFEFKCK